MNTTNAVSSAVILTLACAFLGCVPLAVTQSLEDPFFDILETQMVGLVCTHQLSSEIDPLLEKALIADCKDELDSRGFNTVIIDPSKIAIGPQGLQLRDVDSYPDLLLTVTSGVDHWTETVPETSVAAGGNLPFAPENFSFSSKSVGEHEVTHALSKLCVTLWSGSPDYNNEVWRGELSIDGYKLTKKHEELVEQLFLDEFPTRLLKPWE